MNQIAWQIFGGSKAKANTFIGGVASTITTSVALATKLGVNSNRITNFKIVGSDIECRISGSYSIPVNCFRDDTFITYYRDYENLISIGATAFYHLTSGVNMALTELYFENATTIGSGLCQLDGTGTYPLKRAIFPKATTFIGERHFAGQKNIETVYIPLVTTLGSSVGNQQIFEFTNYASQKRLYVHPSLATNNAGAPDGDITNAIANGWIVRYVTNFTAPNPITNLSVGNVYETAVQLIDNGTSTNAIDYYESVKINGISYANVPVNGYITGLNLNIVYNIEAIAVDIFYNKSTSNVVSVTTATANNFQSEVNDYETRILNDSGQLINKTFINDEYIKMIVNGVSSNIISWHSFNGGIKKDGSNLVEKMYSFLDSNFDVIQTTNANKPTYTASGVTFDLTDTLSKTLSPVVTNKTFTVMWRLKATPGNYYPTINFGSWDSFTMHSASGGLIYSGITIANRFNLGSGSFLTNTDATYTFTYNAVTKIAKIYRNTTLLGTKTMVDPINWTSYGFDAQNGTFYDAKIFSKDLSLTEITSIL